eukprot:CAMPEP_0185736552 /NCGR_PEP_ID=MMETSP1171-20130828/28205_1 /TAXON_ID=374046 /ORGANISM="Helicotheca tamensis, Strain CCMP826" /LENGTH=82 /DNA_ID=CAMNT_0028407203 /DNA_START=55 /DNA_END=299 /DNA_ORIENTATION=+
MTKSPSTFTIPFDSNYAPVDSAPLDPEARRLNILSVLDAALSLSMEGDHEQELSTSNDLETITGKHPRQKTRLESGKKLKSA